MTLEELISYCRLQVDEESDAYWTEENWTTYLVLGAQRLMAHAKAGVYRQSVLMDSSSVADGGVIHAHQITFIADNTSGGYSINGKYFIVDDLDGLSWKVQFTTAGAQATEERQIMVGIAANDTAAACALAAKNAINASSAFPATAEVASEVMTLTWKSLGWTAGAANVDVIANTDILTVAVLTQGYDDSYDLGMPFQKELGILYDAGDGDKYPLRRISWEEWNALSLADRQDSYACFIDAKRAKLFSPFDTGTISLSYLPQITASSLSTALSDVIAEDWHQAIAYYALYQATLRDQEATRSQHFLAAFRALADEAKVESQRREVENIDYGFDTRDWKPQRTPSFPSQGGAFF